MFELPETPTARWDAARRSRRSPAPLDDADFQAAHALYEQGGFPRGEIEARILSGQPLARIAELMDLPEAVVTAYRHWFFDVWNRVPDSTWIHTHAIGLRSKDVWDCDEVEAFWRWFGYKHCFPALDVLLRSVKTSKLEHYGLKAYLRIRVPLPLSIKLQIACGLAPELKSPGELNVLARYAAVPEGQKLLTALGVLSPVARMVMRLLEHANRRRQQVVEGSSRRPRSIEQLFCLM